MAVCSYRRIAIFLWRNGRLCGNKLIFKDKERYEKFKSNEDKEEYHSMLEDCLNNGFYGSASIKETSYLVYDNFWIKYFKDNPIYQKENWIDFGSEISKMIRSLDESNMQTLRGERFSIDDIVDSLLNKTLKERYSKYIEAVQAVN